METGLNMLIKQESLIEWAREKSLPYKELMSYYRCAMMEVETKFKVLSEDFSVKYDRNPIQSIKLRLKSPDSIIDKLSRNSWDISIDSIEKNLNDVAGVRVICSYQADVYELADALLMQDDVELIARKDYIANPKPNGYRSLHLIIAIPIFLHNRKKMMKVEIQIRTLAMDWWASL
ncbi:MAG: GTP pyrophosphokinase family protein, partial [Firmicutes bacterium]|nr:GTP pyrophosphokinase family protein [Bacillota bacterium]